jgi:hypothetical protein
LVEDAYLKASNAGARYFFTWNVNKLVLFDASLWQVVFTVGFNMRAPAGASVSLLR